jgi:hypothetical protein
MWTEDRRSKVGSHARLESAVTVLEYYPVDFASYHERREAKDVSEAFSFAEPLHMPPLVPTRHRLTLCA